MSSARFRSRAAHFPNRAILSRNHEFHHAPGAGTGNRRKGRELALQALYQIEMTGDASAAAVDQFLSHFEGNPKAKEFARRLVSGVVSQQLEIDCLIERCTEHWKLMRLAKVDLIILRMASYELIFCPDIPLNVSLDEAIEIGKRYGTDDSATFINGVLDQVAQSSRAKGL
jgi:N utilization substance protein B